MCAHLHDITGPRDLYAVLGRYVTEPFETRNAPLDLWDEPTVTWNIVVATDVTLSDIA